MCTYTEETLIIFIQINNTKCRNISNFMFLTIYNNITCYSSIYVLNYSNFKQLSRSRIIFFSV